ncbi:CpaE family protein [Paenibacillus chartarius]|uniref:CpaE family protein n=1 Tax=Paenibacillus chartarius TaxID=747481 RepID=A0ABV6DI19_9BACL
MMKIALCVQDERLSEKLVPFRGAAREQWDSFGSVEELCESSRNSDYEYIIVSDRLTDFDRLSETMETLREQNRKAKLLMLLSNHHQSSVNEQYLKLCLAHEASWVPPGRSIGAICDEVRRHIGGDGDESSQSQRKIVLFLGSTPNIGTTTLAFGTAWRLAATTDHKVGYLCLNLKSSKLHRYMGRDSRINSLDVLRAELKSGTLPKERLLQYCEQVKEHPNLHVLYGNMLREQAEFFTAEEIEHLLETAREAFDVCIVDVNAYWDNAATLCGIIRADTRMLVTTGEITHFQEDMNRWTHTLGNIFGIKPDAFELIVTQCMPQAYGGIRAKDICKETQMRVLAEVNRMPELFSAVNRGQLASVLEQSEELQANLEPIVQSVVLLHRLQKKHSASGRKHWLRKLLPRVAAVS